MPVKLIRIDGGRPVELGRFKTRKEAVTVASLLVGLGGHWSSDRTTLIAPDGARYKIVTKGKDDMLMKITLRPSTKLAETLYVKTGLAPKATDYYINVESEVVNMNLTENERGFIFRHFVEQEHVREYVHVFGEVDAAFGHMPTHEQALRCWLMGAGCYTADLEVEAE